MKIKIKDNTPIEKAMKQFLIGYKKVVQMGRQNKAPEKKIEEAQELYVQAFVLTILKISGMPLDKKIEILEKMKSKIQG